MEGQQEYDVIVVGSGAGGSIAAYYLTLRGLKVLLLESGRSYDPRTETPMFQIQADAPLNGAATPDKPLGFYDACVDGGIDIPGEPYTQAPGTRFDWWRARMLGGRTNHWGRVTLRYGPHDFQSYSRTGVGKDWPLSYTDLAPYYDQVERLIGVFGDSEAIENSPDSPPGILLPPPRMRVHELWMKMALAKRMGIRVVPTHVAVLTRPFNGRPACVYATHCARGCGIGANFQSSTVLLDPALATGKLTIRVNAVAFEVSHTHSGLATGVRYMDRVTNAQHSAHSRAVVLAASACETARILLNSTTPLFPNGMANSSGQVGKNLTDSLNFVVSGDIPALHGLPPFNDDGVSVPHAYVPWWGHYRTPSRQTVFPGDYHVEIYGGRPMPYVGMMAKTSDPHASPTFGLGLRRRIKEEFGSKMDLVAHCGMVPNTNSRCEIDPTVRDKWGIPVLRIHWKWGPYELEQMRHATSSLHDMIGAMGGTVTYRQPVPAGGSGMHEVGTTRMGSQRSDSVLTANGHAWDVRNLYVTDGGPFTSHACKNPTHTIMALAWRSCEHLANSFMRKDI